MFYPLSQYRNYLCQIMNIFMPTASGIYANLKRHQVNTVYHNTESVPFLGPKVWGILLDDFKKIDNIDTFKKAIKT